MYVFATDSQKPVKYPTQIKDCIKKKKKKKKKNKIIQLQRIKDCW